MSIEVRTTPLKLGMRSVPAVLEMRRTRGELQIKPQKIQMVAERELPRVLIDQSRCFAECGIKSPEEMTRDSAILARERAFEYIGRIAEEGDRLARIEQGGRGETLFGELALDRMELYCSDEWNIAFIPQSRPEFEVTGGLSIDWRVTKGMVECIPSFLQVKCQPRQLDIYVQQYGKIEYRYVDERA